MKIKATPIKAEDLKPGDLFSNCGQVAWDLFLVDKTAIAQKVYIRTDVPTPQDQKEVEVFKIEIL